MTTDATQTGGTNDQPGGQAGADGKPASTDGTNADPTKGQPGADGKPAADAKPTDDGKQPPKDGAPGEYKFETPEGVELDQARLTEFTTIAKELKLPQEAAQKLVNLAAQHELSRAEAYAKQTAAWADEVKADKDLGGDKLAESIATARKAIDLGPPELKEFLKATGMGNHPAIFRWAHAVGKALSEDTMHRGNSAPAGSKSAADVLYGGTNT